MLPRYRQHVARTSNLLLGNMLPSTWHWRIQDFRLGGRSSAEGASIEGVWGLGNGVPLPNGGGVLGEGCAPSPETFWIF